MDVSAHYASRITVVASMFHHLPCLTILKEELSPFYIYLTICKYLASFFFREFKCQGLEVCLLRGSLNGREKEVRQAPRN